MYYNNFVSVQAICLHFKGFSKNHLHFARYNLSLLKYTAFINSSKANNQAIVLLKFDSSQLKVDTLASV